MEREEGDEAEEVAVKEEGKGEGGDAGAGADADAAVLPSAGYEYLLRVATLSCTTEHARRLRQEADKLRAQLQELQNTLPVDMWSRDLDDFEKGLEDFAKRKDEALVKNIKNPIKPPKHRHKGEVLAERRASNKQAREKAEAQVIAHERETKKKQETKRLAREVKRRATMHNSPTAKQMLEKLQAQGVVTPVVKTAPASAGKSAPQAPPSAKSPGGAKGGATADAGKGDPIFEAALAAAGGLPPAPGAGRPVAKGGQA